MINNYKAVARDRRGRIEGESIETFDDASPEDTNRAANVVARFAAGWREEGLTVTVSVHRPGVFDHAIIGEPQ